MANLFEFNPDAGETPDTLATKRAIALALMRGAASTVPHNAGEGLALVGNRLAAAIAMNRFRSAELGAYKQLGSAMGDILGPGAPAASPAPVAPSAPSNVPVTPSVPAEALSGNSLVTTPADLSGGNLPTTSQVSTASPDYASAIASIESKGSGNYNAIGPRTASGDRAYGKYQIMGANIPAWTKAALGTAMTPQQFLADPQAQDATFRHQFGQYVQQYGPEGAAKAWFGGPGNINNPGASDSLGTTVAGYARKFMNAIGPTQAQAVEAPSDPRLAALLSPDMGATGPSGALAAPSAVDGAALAFNGSPATAANPLTTLPASPASSVPPVGSFAPIAGPQPNVTDLAVKPTTLPILSGRQAVAQALAAKPQITVPQQQPSALGMPPQVAETIRKLSMIPLPQAQNMAAALMQRYMQPRPYQLIQGADGTVTAINPLNPRDNYVAAHIAPKPIAVPLGGTLVSPGSAVPTAGAAPNGQPTSAASSSGFHQVFQNQTGLFDKPTLTAMADQYLAGDRSVLQNLGRSNMGAMNIAALRERIVSRAQDRGISPTDIAARLGQFDSYIASQKATGTRAGNITMAAIEAGNLGKQVVDTSSAVPRTSYPIWNRVTNSYKENTGNPQIVQFTAALNSYINAYARAINPSGSTTVSDKEHAREILDTAMSHGQIQAGVAQLQRELEQVKKSPATASKTLSEQFTARTDPKAQKSGDPLGMRANDPLGLR